MYFNSGDVFEVFVLSPEGGIVSARGGKDKAIGEGEFQFVR